jgi:hypothetical protein
MTLREKPKARGMTLTALLPSLTENGEDESQNLRRTEAVQGVMSRSAGQELLSCTI